MAQKAAVSFTAGGGSSRNLAKMEREGESELGEELEELKGHPMRALNRRGEAQRRRQAVLA